jgi:hypothetical protein
MGRDTVLLEDPAEGPVPPVKLFDEAKLFEVPRVSITLE